MTNRIAIGLALLIAAAFAADWFLFGGALPVFLGKQLVTILEFVAVWR